MFFMNRERILPFLRLFLSHIVMSLIVFVILFPLIYAILVSTQTFHEYYHFPPKLFIGSSMRQNFTHAWIRAELGKLLFNTIFISVVVAVGKIVLSIISGFAFVYFNFKGKNVLFGLILLTHMLPLPVRIVSTYQLMGQLGWLNTYWALTIPFFASATGTLLFRQFYMTIPVSLAEAARMDGANPLQFLWHVLLPVSGTNITALFLVEFIYIWNQYLWPLLIANTDTTRVIQVGLKILIDTEAAVEWNIVMAGTIITMIPPLIILLVTQHSLITGLSLTENK